MKKKQVVAKTKKEALTTSNTTADEVSPQCLQYVDRYRAFARNSAENLIDLAETVLEAEQALSPREFKQFCDEVNLEPNGPTHRKFKKIGESADRFKAVLHQLPPNWTTLYGMAALPSDQFDRVANSGHLTPLMTAKELKSIAGGKSDGRRTGKKKAAIHCDITIDLHDLPDDDKCSIYRKVIELSDEFEFRVVVGRELAALLKSSSSQEPTMEIATASAQ